MSFTISDDVLFAARMSEAEMAMEVAVILYRDGNLPLARAAEFARMGERQFAHLLASRDVPLEDPDIWDCNRMSITVPDELLASTCLSERDVATELALEMYQREKLSLGKAAEIAGISRCDFHKLLGERGLYLTYGVDDLEQDLATMRRLGQL